MIDETHAHNSLAVSILISKTDVTMPYIKKENITTISTKQLLELPHTNN